MRAAAKASSWPAPLALVLVAGLWGLTFIFTKVGLAQLTPAAFVAGRFAVAAVAASGWLLLAQRRAKGSLVGWRAGLALGLINLAVQLMQALSVQGLSASRAALLAGSHLLFVPGMQALAGLQRPSYADLAACALCLAGLVLVAGDTQVALAAAEAWAIAAEVAFAAYVVAAALIGASAASPVVLTTCQLWVTAVGAAVMAGPSLATIADANAATWGALLACALGCTLVPTWLQLRFGAQLAPSHAALLLSLEPPLAAVCATVYLGDRLSSAAWVGAAMMLLAAAAPSLVAWRAATAATNAARKAGSGTGLSR